MFRKTAPLPLHLHYRRISTRQDLPGENILRGRLVTKKRTDLGQNGRATRSRIDTEAALIPEYLGVASAMAGSSSTTSASLRRSAAADRNQFLDIAQQGEG